MTSNLNEATTSNCDRLDAYSLKYLNKGLDSHQITAMADRALIEDLSVAIRRERVFRNRKDLWKVVERRFRLPRPVLLVLCHNLEPQ